MLKHNIFNIDLIPMSPHTIYNLLEDLTDPAIQVLLHLGEQPNKQNTWRVGADELEAHRGSFISSQANIADSSEYLTPVREFFLVKTDCNNQNENIQISYKSINFG